VLKAYADLGIELGMEQAGALLEQVQALVARTKRPPRAQDLQQLYSELQLSEAPPVAAFG
jgi:hypothetical protein